MSRSLKPITLALALLFVGCVAPLVGNDTIDAVYVLHDCPPPSCRVAVKSLYRIPVSEEEAKTLFDVVDGELQIYEVEAEDERTFVVDRDQFDSLAIGDSIPLCTLNSVTPCPAR